jgi:hypothetical protein
MERLWVKEQPALQTPNERLIYTITTTPWQSSPTSPVFTAYDLWQDRKDVTTTVFPSTSHSVSGDVITSDLLRALTVDHEYEIHCKFTVGSEKWVCRFMVHCVPYYIQGGRLKQIAAEEHAYTLDTSNRISSPTSSTMTVYDHGQSETDVTADVTSGSTSESGDVITLKTLKSLTAGHTYRVAVQFTVSTQIFEPSFLVDAI